ncbi:MFS transporter [Terriglobus roseus]|uniref:MFS transporter n=1 Tax=Terriglobus roseus TaxID=392734 RepID=UPI00155F8ACF|nr:MFS transporter [Terriglobus roseus]
MHAAHTSPRRWLYAGLLLLASVVNYIDRQTLSVLAVTMQHDLHLTDVDYGHVVQAFLLAYMVMYTLSGRLVDRFGARWTQGVFLLVWSVADACTGFARGFFSLATSRFALGAAEPGNYTASLRASGDWFNERERSIAVGIYSMGGTLGAAIAVPIAAGLATAFGWRSAFFVTGAIGALLAAVWMLLYRDPAVQRERAASVPWLTVLRQPHIAALLITRTMTDSVWYFFLFWSVKYMQDTHGLTLKTVGTTLWILYVAADIGSLLGGFISGKLVPRFGALRARFVIMLPVAACMFALCTVPHLHSTSAAITVLSGLALCHMAWMTNATVMTLDLFPRSMATTVQGMIGSASAAGGLLTAAAIGSSIQTHGYTPVFYGLCILHPLAALLLWWRIGSRAVVGGQG